MNPRLNYSSHFCGQLFLISRMNYIYSSFSVILMSTNHSFLPHEHQGFKNFKSKSFKSDVRKEDWRTVLNCTNINDCLSRFLHKFNKISNKHAPIKVLKIKNKSCKPWITSGLKNLLKLEIIFTKNG